MANSDTAALISVETAPDQWLIYPPDLADRVQACWFDREYWGAAAQPLSADKGGRSAPLLLPTDPGPSVWRHYQRGGAVARLLGDRYYWGGLERSRAWCEMRVTLALYERGLRVPRPLAARVLRSGRWYRADLLTQCLQSTQTLAQRWVASAVTDSDLQAVGAAIAALHAAGCDHADLNAHNLLFDDQKQVWALDFDRALLRPAVGVWCAANLNRLQRSLAKVGVAPSSGQWQSLLESYRSALATSTRLAANGRPDPRSS